MIDVNNPDIPVYRQCDLINLSRSNCYYKPIGESELNLELMNRIDALNTKFPYYGSRKITAQLIRDGYPVNRKRIARLMEQMCIQAIFAKKRTSIPNKEHMVYPYLLRDVTVDHANHVWATDITYIRMAKGFIYLVAVMDWYSRYVLSWEISLSLEKDFCITALERALRYGRPEIFNTDQGSQFTSLAFTGILDKAGVRISMDGKGRAFDNIFVERLWRTVKYEEVYLKDYQTVKEAATELKNYFELYNNERLHASLDYMTPAEVYNGG